MCGVDVAVVDRDQDRQVRTGQVQSRRRLFDERPLLGAELAIEPSADRSNMATGFARMQAPSDREQLVEHASSEQRADTTSNLRNSSRRTPTPGSSSR